MVVVFFTQTFSNFPIRPHHASGSLRPCEVYLGWPWRPERQCPRGLCGSLPVHRARGAQIWRERTPVS